MWNLFENGISNLNNPSSAINSIFEDPVNTFFNGWGASATQATFNVAKQQLSIAKTALDYQIRLFDIFSQTHKVEDDYYEDTGQLFLEILKTMKEMKETQERTNVLLEKLLGG